MKRTTITTSEDVFHAETQHLAAHMSYKNGRMLDSTIRGKGQNSLFVHDAEHAGGENEKRSGTIYDQGWKGEPLGKAFEEEQCKQQQNKPKE